MAKRSDFIGGMGTANFLRDADWITVIGALLQDSSAESRRLAYRLLDNTKQGRHVRLVRLIHTRHPTTVDMQKALKMSRRTIFRYLNGLEGYGVRFNIGSDFRYEIVRLPDNFRTLIARIKG